MEATARGGVYLFGERRCRKDVACVQLASADLEKDGKRRERVLSRKESQIRAILSQILQGKICEAFRYFCQRNCKKGTHFPPKKLNIAGEVSTGNVPQSITSCI